MASELFLREKQVDASFELQLMPSASPALVDLDDFPACLEEKTLVLLLARVPVPQWFNNSTNNKANYCKHQLNMGYTIFLLPIITYYNVFLRIITYGIHYFLIITYYYLRFLL